MNFKKRIILAPMVGVCDIAYRRLCTDFGADIVYSQMIDAKALLKGNLRLADFFDETNVVAQFFGNDAKTIAECVKLLDDKVQGFDLNLGCPHSNVVNRKCGSYLMKYPAKISKIVKNMVKSTDKPITAKIRAGYDKEHINAVKTAKILEKEGASAVAVHGRARTVNYKQPSDNEIIRQVKNAVSIPVIGNGDVFTGEDAKEMLSICDSVMIGRAAMGNPLIFDEIKKYPKKIKKIPTKKIFEKYLRYAKKYCTEFDYIKKHAQWLTKGMTKGGYFRDLMNIAKSADDILRIYENDNFK